MIMANIPDPNDERYKKIIEELTEMMKNISIVPSTATPSGSHGSWIVPHPVHTAETDEQGNVIGYKVLIFDLQEGRFVSPLYQVRWEGSGWLQSDREPKENNRHGIYTLKSFHDTELDDYYYQEQSKNSGIRYQGRHTKRYVFKVRCIISGVIVEGEYGFRSQFAQVEGVYNGYWKTYQDFYNEARYESRRRTETRTYQDFTRYSDSYRTYIAGAWNTRPKLADEDSEESGS